jgi:hypothetical protein
MPNKIKSKNKRVNIKAIEYVITGLLAVLILISSWLYFNPAMSSTDIGRAVTQQK